MYRPATFTAGGTNFKEILGALTPSRKHKSGVLVMKLTHVSKERCSVYNMNLCGIHWQGKEGGVL